MTRTKIFIPTSPDIEEWGGETQGVYITASEVHDVITSNDHRCAWETTRRGQLQPCDRDTVAIRWDHTNHVLTQVCKGHARGILVPLSFITEVAMVPRERRQA